MIDKKKIEDEDEEKKNGLMFARQIHQY